MSLSAIEWTDATWNPTTGCDIISPGCKNCYAKTMAKRLKAMGQARYQKDGNPPTSGPGFGVTCHEDALGIPLHWRKPRMVFVDSMSDLFHPEVPFDFILKVYGIMSQASWHTYQILTKRPERRLQFFRDCKPHLERRLSQFPLPNVWEGTSVENQLFADQRIPILLETPAAVRWVSYEPALGPVNWIEYLPILAVQRAVVHHRRTGHNCGGGGATADCDECRTQWEDAKDGLDWVVVGGESGPNARPFNIEWARSTVRQCRDARVPVFVKQVGSYPMDRNDRFSFGSDEPDEWPDGAGLEDDYIPSYQGEECRVVLRDRKGGDPSEWPEDLRVREYPTALRREQVKP